MSLLIAADQNQTGLKMKHILNKYFPSSTNDNIKISNKYYQAEIRISVDALPSLSKYSEIEMVIVLMEMESHYENMQAILHHINHSLSQSSAIICVNRPKQMKQVGWIHEKDIAESEEFIQVIYQDIHQIYEELPPWKQTGLLESSDQSFPQIFSIFELINTTNWTDKQLAKTKKQEEVDQKSEKREAHECGQSEELSEQQLEREMNEFESMLHSIMKMKEGEVSDQKRKAMAENIMMQITNNIDI